MYKLNISQTTPYTHTHTPTRSKMATTTMPKLVRLPDVKNAPNHLNSNSFTTSNNNINNQSNSTHTHHSHSALASNDSRLLDEQKLLATKLAKNNHNSTFGLHQSILNGRLKQVNYFLKMGLKVNSKDKYGRTCLMLATLCDHEEYGLQAAKLLISFGADLNVCDTLGRTCVYMAISQKREKLFNYFIDNHSAIIDYRSKDNDGNVLLNHAAVHGTVKMVRKIVDKMKVRYIDLDQRNKCGYTALLLAIKNDKYLTAYALVKDPTTSPALRDNEKYMNAIEWLSSRINANRDLILNTNLTSKNLSDLVQLTSNQQENRQALVKCK